tara:strand:- start:2484 stop:2804 length:321 start_codon:yes stop_codon:yes gene_type:complete
VLGGDGEIEVQAEVRLILAGFSADHESSAGEVRRCVRVCVIDDELEDHGCPAERFGALEPFSGSMSDPEGFGRQPESAFAALREGKSVTGLDARTEVSRLGKYELW